MRSSLPYSHYPQEPSELERVLHQARQLPIDQQITLLQELLGEESGVGVLLGNDYGLGSVLIQISSAPPSALATVIQAVADRFRADSERRIDNLFPPPKEKTNQANDQTKIDDFRQGLTELSPPRNQSNLDWQVVLDALPFPTWIDDQITERAIYQNQVSRQLWGDFLGKTIHDLDLDPWTLRNCMREDWLVRQGRWIRAETYFGLSGQEILYDKILIPLQGQILGLCIPKS